MRDPEEGLTAEGMIVTGACRDSVVASFEPVLTAAIAALSALPRASDIREPELHLYGSVATGQAVVGASDVDLLTIGITREAAARIGTDLSARFAELCRGVEIGVAQFADFARAAEAPGEDRDADERYGNRVFLRHYCVPLCGPNQVRERRSFPGDAPAARGFNGDIDRSRGRWLEALEATLSETAPDREFMAALGRRIARKTLLAVAGLVSVHDHSWTTDRLGSARRWSALRPEWKEPLQNLVSWSGDLGVSEEEATGEQVRAILHPDGLIAAVVADFDAEIGLWS